MSISNWVQTRIKQIASLSEYDSGGKDKTKIDSNEEYACLAKLLANCTTLEDRKFIKEKMDEYMGSTSTEHFEHPDGTSYDEVYDSSNNRMYVAYDEKGNFSGIETTYKKDNCEYSKEKIDLNEYDK